MRAHQPGSTPIDIPETVPNPAYTPVPAPAPERAPTKVPEKVPEKIIAPEIRGVFLSAVNTAEPKEFRMHRPNGRTSSNGWGLLSDLDRAASDPRSSTGPPGRSYPGWAVVPPERMAETAHRRSTARNGISRARDRTQKAARRLGRDRNSRDRHQESPPHARNSQRSPPVSKSQRYERPGRPGNLRQNRYFSSRSCTFVHVRSRGFCGQSVVRSR